ncbi:hypothetical protein [Salinimicrobium flavum]|uniref:Uncharacterized protein n=1 Tax=Salinimicrobium flavum TaxID=1737065 RepID=A0ABW5IY82_9FLAO
MDQIKKSESDFLSKESKENFIITWNWLFQKSHIIFAVLIIIGMLFFIWWLSKGIL